MGKPWYEIKREEEYEELYRYNGVETIEDDYDREYREALKDTQPAKMIELRYELRKTLGPVTELFFGER